MYEIDYLPVESEGAATSKSGDAICVRFTVEQTQRQAVIVIDGGYSEVGTRQAEHIQDVFRTNRVDLMISTHPHADHLNGLYAAMEELDVVELLIHQPRRHINDVADFSNLASVDDLIKLAASRGTIITEPFMGLERFGGQVRVLGPTELYYEAMLKQHLDEVRTGVAAARARQTPVLLAKAVNLLERGLGYLPVETLTDEGETGPRNNSSVITLLEVDGRRLLFTGDAGVPALEQAADVYENTVGAFAMSPLHVLDVPHHGSRRNLGPTLLDRMLGQRGMGYNPQMKALISSAAIDPKHPSPKVVNAILRRGGTVYGTEGRGLCYGEGHQPHYRGIATPYGPLNEDD